MGTPFIIDDNVRARAKEVVAYARAHRLNAHDMMRASKHADAGILQPVGHDVKRQLYIPMGFILVYSIEQHPEGDWFHHVSMSSGAKGRAPLPQAIDMALEAMGIPERINDAVHVWLEDLSGGEKAVNVLLKFSE